MSTKVETASNERHAKLALRRRASEHPVVMLSILGACALAVMFLTPASGPAFASLNPPYESISVPMVPGGVCAGLSIGLRASVGSSPPGSTR